MKLVHVIKKPLITEKVTQLTAQGKYSFAVARPATKIQIRQAVEKFFKVKVRAVNTVTMKGKKRRVGRSKKLVKGSDWKKAIVQLAEGEKIDLFPEAESPHGN